MTLRGRAMVGLALLASIVPSGPVAGQEPTATIEVVSRSVLADSPDGILGAGPPLATEMTPRGLFVVTAGFAPAHAAAGTRELAAFARPGDGPGEYRQVSWFDSSGDTLLMYDAGLRRVSRFVRGRFVGQHRGPPVAVAKAARVGPFLVLGGPLSTPEATGYPLHVADTTGRIVRSLGSRLDAASAADGFALLRLVTAVDDSTFAAIDPITRTLALMSLDGGVIRTGRPPARWWVGRPPPAADPLEWRPSSFVRQIRRVAPHVLLMLSLTPEKEWRRGLGANQQLPDGRAMLNLERTDQVYDAVLEVVDLRTLQVTARVTLDEDVVGIAGDNSVVAYAQREDGSPALEVITWRLRQERR